MCKISREPKGTGGNRRGTSVANARELEGNQYGKRWNSKGTGREPDFKASQIQGNQQGTKPKNVGFPREPGGTSVQTLPPAREAAENERKKRRVS